MRKIKFIISLGMDAGVRELKIFSTFVWRIILIRVQSNVDEVFIKMLCKEIRVCNDIFTNFKLTNVIGFILFP